MRKTILETRRDVLLYSAQYIILVFCAEYSSEKLTLFRNDLKGRKTDCLRSLFQTEGTDDM